MTREQAIRSLDVLMNPASTREEKRVAYDRLRELFIILLPDE